MNKVHKSALCIVPPSHVWQQIQAIRVVHDKSYVRWMPHINLMYPFYEDTNENFEQAAHQAADALRTMPTFKASPKFLYNFEQRVSLNIFNHFQHSRSSSTVWLNPEASPSNSIQDIHAALLTIFPDCSDLSNDPARGITQFSPHLSVGQWSGKQAAEQAQQELANEWTPIEFEVADVALISRKGYNDPFTLRYRVPLGGHGMPREVNETYVVPPPGGRPRTGVKNASRRRNKG